MFEPFKIDRKLPPHELNARRNRKRAVTTLPHIIQVSKPCQPGDQQPCPNDQVYNHGADPVTHHE